MSAHANNIDVSTVATPAVAIVRPASIDPGVKPTESIPDWQIGTTAYSFYLSPKSELLTRPHIETDRIYNSDSSRPTTNKEKIIGEIRGFSSLAANWDGEGALKPRPESIRDAVSFLMLMEDHALLPESVLHVSGNVALFWNREDFLYADIEFLGGNKIAYFIKLNQDRHKGVISFDSEQIPAVFPAVFLV